MAFFKTKQLTEIKLPDSLNSVGKACFQECQNLEEVTLPAKGFVVSNDMFEYCTALKKVNNADKIVQVDDYAFYSTTHLKQIDLSAVAKIGKNAFAFSGLTSIKLSKCCKVLDVSAFYLCEKLKLADLSESSIEYFPPYSFYQCTSEVILPNKIWNIGASAFTRCSIKDLTISGQNVMIDRNAFADAKIDTLTFKDNPDSQVWISKKAFEDAFIGDLTIPDYLYNKYKNIWDNIK